MTKTKARPALKQQPKRLPVRLWHDKVRKILGQRALDDLRSNRLGVAQRGR